MTTTLLDAIARLDASLDQLARALASGDTTQVLAAEEPLASALSALARADRRGVEPKSLRHAIDGVRLSVARCEALGRSAEEFSRTLFPQAGYGRAGLQLVSTSSSRQMASVT